MRIWHILSRKRIVSEMAIGCAVIQWQYQPRDLWIGVFVESPRVFYLAFGPLFVFRIEVRR
jgi:hypothetical protein